MRTNMMTSIKGPGIYLYKAQSMHVRLDLRIYSRVLCANDMVFPFTIHRSMAIRHPRPLGPRLEEN